jgi:DNA-binding CsgD family transcriptional regulator
MIAPHKLNASFYAGLVGRIYESALEPSRWDEVVDTLADIYPDARITMFAHRDGRPTMTLHRNFDAGDLRAYVEYYVKNSPYIRHLNRVVVGRPTFSEDQVPLADLFDTEHFNDFVHPRRIGYHATGVLLEKRPNGLTSLSFSDLKDTAPRRAHQKRLLGVIAPHLMRAISLGRATAAQQATAVATQAVLNRWDDAAFVLDAEGRLATMNEAAAELLKGGDCVSLDRNGLLRSFDDGVTGCLAAAIRACLDISGKLDLTVRDIDRNGVILPRKALAQALQAMVWPLPYDVAHPEFDGERGRVLVMIFEPGRRQQTDIGWIARRFGLSTSEAALMAAVVGGKTLAEAAEALCIQLSTARTRLKSILHKTGSDRQVDLVRLALSRPQIRRS